MALIDVLQDLGASLDKNSDDFRGYQSGTDPVAYYVTWADENGSFRIDFNYTDRWIQGKQAGIGAVSGQVALTEGQADALKTKFDDNISARNTAKYGALITSLDTFANS
jgi:hypothetical protein